jgi:hypothetical protein
MIEALSHVCRIFRHPFHSRAERRRLGGERFALDAARTNASYHAEEKCARGTPQFEAAAA